MTKGTAASPVKPATTPTRPTGEPADVAGVMRRKRTLQWPITLSVVMMVLNVGLMVVWIVLLARSREWSLLTIGTIVFGLILVGLGVYLVLTIKEVRLNQRQVNFVDSVTHELKSPIASLKMYLQTLQMRHLPDDRREHFYEVMEGELQRLDELISHLLEVSRLDAIGQDESPEDVELGPLLRSCAEAACRHHQVPVETAVVLDVAPMVVRARRTVLEMIFRNLIDNGIKYNIGEDPVEVVARSVGRDSVSVEIRDRGPGVPPDIRRKIFRVFYRGGNELERTRKGTGLGLYIVRTLVRLLRGHVSVADRGDGPGSVFRVEIPGRALP